MRLVDKRSAAASVPALHSAVSALSAVSDFVLSWVNHPRGSGFVPRARKKFSLTVVWASCYNLYVTCEAGIVRHGKIVAPGGSGEDPQASTVCPSDLSVLD